MGTTNPATPNIAFGKPNNEACQRSNKGPHATKGLMSHERSFVGFCSDLTLSIRRDADANQPMAPATMKILASERKDFSKFIFSCSRSVNPDLFVLISRASLQALMVTEPVDMLLSKIQSQRNYVKKSCPINRKIGKGPDFSRPSHAQLLQFF